MLVKTLSKVMLPATQRAVVRAEWLGAFVKTHHQALLRAALDEGVTADEALDAMQDAAATFLTRSLWFSLESKPDEARALLLTLTRNHARNRRRRAGRKTEPLEVAPESADDPSVSLGHEVEHARRHVLLTGCISTLRDTQRAVVVARLLEGESGEAVAKTLGLTPGNVAVVLHRARERLRACVLRSERRFA